MLSRNDPSSTDSVSSNAGFIAVCSTWFTFRHRALFTNSWRRQLKIVGLTASSASGRLSLNCCNEDWYAHVINSHDLWLGLAKWLYCVPRSFLFGLGNVSLNLLCCQHKNSFVTFLYHQFWTILNAIKKIAFTCIILWFVSTTNA